ncbi:MAG: response regulator [Pseudomonadota bacterium]|nr:response regulator [Pseudomonadota bacterium]
MPADNSKKRVPDRLLDILIVDDDPMIRLLLQGGINADRFSVSVTESGSDAIAMCDANPFDFVILDYRMPGKSGLDVASALHRQKIPFIMLSAFADETIVQRAARFGALGYLVKPVTPKQVELAIDTALARAGEIGNLVRAAEVSGIVGIAVGLVMVSYGISRMRALEKLRSFCRPRNRTLKEVSLEITNLIELHIDTGSQKSPCDALEEYLKGTDKI